MCAHHGISRCEISVEQRDWVLSSVWLAEPGPPGPWNLSLRSPAAGILQMGWSEGPGAGGVPGGPEAQTPAQTVTVTRGLQEGRVTGITGRRP